MTLHSIGNQVRQRLENTASRGMARLRASALRHPVAAAALIASTCVLLGASVGGAESVRLQAQLNNQQDLVEVTRREAQREVNALAARVSELQAQANRLNALGERLPQVGQLGDGEFDFKEPIALGGVGPVENMPVSGLIEDMDAVQGQFEASGSQLSVLEALLFDRQLELASVPSRSPVTSTYITSGYGNRADPFSGGRSFHRRIDFGPRRAEPVIAGA